MARIGTRCKKCKSTFDVTDLEPGSKFRCGECSEIVVVPDPARKRKAAAGSAKAAAPPVASAAAPSRPAAPAKAAPEAATPASGKKVPKAPTRRGSTSRVSTRSEGRRAATGQVRAGSKRGKAPTGRRRQKSEPEPPPAEIAGEEEGERHHFEHKNSNTGLYIALGSIGLIVILGGLYKSGIFAPKPPPVPDPAVVAAQEQAEREKAEAALEDWYQKTWANLLAKVSRDNSEISAQNCIVVAHSFQADVLIKAEKLKLSEERIQAWEERVLKAARMALDYDPENNRAHEILGHVRFMLDESSLEFFDAFDVTVLDQLRPAMEGFVTAEEAARLKALELEQVARFKDTPELAEFEKNCNAVRENFKYYDILKDHDWEYRIARRDDGSRAHYAIFEEKVEGRDSTDMLIEKLAILEREYDFLEREFFAPLELTRDVNQPLVFISMRDRESYIAFVTKYEGDDEIATKTLGYYSPKTGYFVYSNDPNASGGISDDEVLVHEAAHQIVDAFCDPPNSGKDQDSRCAWIEEGFADYVSSFHPDTIDNKSYWEFGTPAASRQDLLRTALAFNQMSARLGGAALPDEVLVPVRRLVGVKSRGTMMDEVVESLKDPAAKVQFRSNPFFENLVMNLMYAQGCTFINFMFAHEDGKYREQFRNYLDLVFTGKCNTSRRSRAKLAECLGFESDDSSTWERLDKEYRAYIEKILGH